MPNEVTELRDLAEHTGAAQRAISIPAFAAAFNEAAEQLEEILADQTGHLPNVSYCNRQKV